MTGNFGIQLSLELTRLPKLAKTGSSFVTSVINHARELRKTGSDIVTEADLNSVFGRAKIEENFLGKYRDAVKIRDFALLYEGSQLGLDSGAGPTVQHALRQPDYTATA